MIFLTMLLMGILLGFVGAGGSGFIIGLLVVLFSIPIHTALGTSIAAMVLTTLSGSISHFKEGNAVIRTGLIVGVFGAIGAFGGTFVSRVIPGDLLVWMTSGMLFLSGILIWIRTRMNIPQEEKDERAEFRKIDFWLRAIMTGLGTGALSGIFGIGSTPFIQLALLIFFGFSLRQAVGTTMVVILPIALFGSIGFFQAGYLDWLLLAQVVLGTTIGSFIGAKFTKLAPRFILRTAMILTPILGGTIMLFH